MTKFSTLEEWLDIQHQEYEEYLNEVKYTHSSGPSVEFNDKLGLTTGAIGGAVGGVTTNKLMKKAQAKKLQALIDKGASQSEIDALKKKQKRNRLLGSIGATVGGAAIGSRVKPYFKAQNRRTMTIETDD